MTHFVDPDTFTGDDASRFQQALASVPWSTNDPLVLELRRSRYRLDRTVKIAPQARQNGKIIIRGHGAELEWHGSSGPMVQVGDRAAGKKVWWSEIRGVRFDPGPGTPTTGLYVDSADALSIDDCHGGGGLVGLGTNHNTKYLNLRSCFFGGRDVCADINANIVTIENCKFSAGAPGGVSAARVGLRYTGVGLDARGLDLSFCSQYGIELFKAANVAITGYSEKIGPKQQGNTAAVLRADSSRAIELGMVFNCTFGTRRSGTHAAYGLHLSNCQGVDIRNGVIQLPSIAGAYLDDETEDVTFRRTARWDPQGPAPLVAGNTSQWYRE